MIKKESQENQRQNDEVTSILLFLLFLNHRSFMTSVSFDGQSATYFVVQAMCVSRKGKIVAYKSVKVKPGTQEYSRKKEAEVQVSLKITQACKT